MAKTSEKYQRVTDSGKKYHRMTDSEMIKEAKDIRGEENLEERVERTMEIQQARKENLMLDLPIREMAMRVSPNEMEKIHKDIFEAYKRRVDEKDKNLTHPQALDFSKRIAELVVPAFYFGPAGNEEMNYQNLRSLLSRLAVKKGSDRTVWDEFIDTIRAGRGTQAIHLAMETLEQMRRSQSDQTFDEYLIPPGDKQGEFAYKASQILADKMNQKFIDSKMPHYLNPADLYANIVDAFKNVHSGPNEYLEKYHTEKVDSIDKIPRHFKKDKPHVGETERD